MPIGNVGNLYQDPLLSNVGSRIRNRAFIAHLVLTAVAVGRRTFKYVEWDEVGFDLHETKAAPKGSPNQISMNGTKKDGQVDTHFLSDVLDPQDIEQAGGEIPLATLTTETITDGLLLRREKTVADKLFDGGTITNNTTLVGNDQWSNSNSDPQLAIRQRGDAMKVAPNTLVIGREVETALITHPKVREAFRGQALPSITNDWLAKYLGIERVIVGEAFYNSAKAGQARTLVRLWGKKALLCYVSPKTPSPLMDDPTLGYMPTLGGYTPGQAGQGAPPVRIYTARNGMQGTGEGVLFVKGEMDYATLISAPSLGFLFQAAA